jgi:hypothetical protein
MLFGALLNHLISPLLMDARGLTGRDNATSGKRESEFYMMNGAISKEILAVGFILYSIALSASR